MFYSHYLDLTPGIEKIFSSFRDSNRRNIKRAQGENMKVHISDSLDSVKAFYRLNCLTRKFHGLPPQPWYFFRQIYEYILSTKKGFVTLASCQNKMIAGAVYFLCREKAIFKYGAFDRSYQHLRPNNLVMWEAIKWCVRNNFKTFSLGRTGPENQGLLQFKHGWDAKEGTINYYKYDLKQDCFLAKQTGIKSSYNFFKIMPLSILRFAGNFFYRHVG